MVVAGLARRVEKIKELEQGLEECSGKLHAVECDVSKEESVISAFAWVQENLGPASVLVNNAGMTKESSLIGNSLNLNVFDIVVNLDMNREMEFKNSMSLNKSSSKFLWHTQVKFRNFGIKFGIFYLFKNSYVNLFKP